jgi:hypothetical protein
MRILPAFSVTSFEPSGRRVRSRATMHDPQERDDAPRRGSSDPLDLEGGIDRQVSDAEVSSSRIRTTWKLKPKSTHVLLG